MLILLKIHLNLSFFFWWHLIYSYYSRMEKCCNLDVCFDIVPSSVCVCVDRIIWEIVWGLQKKHINSPQKRPPQKGSRECPLSLTLQSHQSAQERDISSAAFHLSIFSIIQTSNVFCSVVSEFFAKYHNQQAHAVCFAPAVIQQLV